MDTVIILESEEENYSFEADVLEAVIEDLTQHRMPYANCGLSFSCF